MGLEDGGSFRSENEPTSKKLKISKLGFKEMFGSSEPDMDGIPQGFGQNQVRSSVFDDRLLKRQFGPTRRQNSVANSSLKKKD